MATLDPGQEAGKGVLFPPDPRSFIVPGGRTVGANLMGLRALELGIHYSHNADGSTRGTYVRIYVDGDR